MKTTGTTLAVRLLAGTAAAAIALSGGASFAQDAPAEESASKDEQGGLNVIIVTARKVNENLQDVPVAVTAFSGDELLIRNVQNVADIAAFTPGMAMRQGQASPSAVTISLRGQVQTDILATLDPSVGTYVDGVYWARAYGLNTNLLDVESVQVLKGPQGTLFGRNTTGGALLINSNNPDLNDFSGRFTVSYGRFNEFETIGVLNVPIVSDRVALRVAANRTTRDGFTQNVVPANTTTVLAGNTVVARGPFTDSQNGLKYDNRDRWNARAKLSLQATDNLNITFSGEIYDADETAPARNIRLAVPGYTANFGAANIAPAGASCTPGAATNSCPNTTFAVGGSAGLFVGVTNGGPPPTSGANAAASTALGLSLLNGQAATLSANPQTTANNERPYAVARTYTAGMTATLAVPWGEAKLITGWRQIRTATGIDLDGTQYPIHFTEGQQKIEQRSYELQTTGDAFDGALNFAAGLYAFNESGFDQSISVTVPALNGATTQFYGLIDSDSMGFYAQASYSLTDALTFTGGLRYSVDDKALETRNSNYVRASRTTICAIVPVAPFVVAEQTVAPEQCAFSGRDSFSAWTYTFGLDYQVSDDVLVYAKTAKGFRSGGQNLRAPTTAVFLPFEPEIAYSYEVGLKSEFFDRRLRLNLAAYTSDVNNIQRSTLIAAPPIPPSTVPGTATILGNAGKARFRGVEVELAVLVTEGLTLSASGALVDPEYVEFSDLSGDRSFERFTGVAEEQLVLSADYSKRFSNDIKLLANLNYAWSGDVPTAEYNFPANPLNQAIVDATTAPALGLLGARIGIEFDNFGIAIFGRNLTNEREYVQNLLVAPLGYVAGIRQEPRTYGVTGTFTF